MPRVADNSHIPPDGAPPEGRLQVDRPPVAARAEVSVDDVTPEQRVVAAAAAAWVNQFARTIKTCRLYDHDNPTVVRFREELGAATSRLLAQHGAITLTFTASDILCHDVSLHPARSREDNLAMVFFRDGVRTLTFQPGFSASELESLLDIVMRSSSWKTPDQDLVTLLWDTELPHLELTYVATEGDVEGGGEDAADPAGKEPKRWPRSQESPRGAGSGSETGGAPASVMGAGVQTDRELDSVFARSDDHLTHETIGQLEIVYRRLSDDIVPAIERLRADHALDHAGDIVSASLAMIGDCLQAGSEAADLEEYGAFLPRVMREALALGMWAEARAAYAMLGSCRMRHWSLQSFLEELCGVELLITRNAVTRLDGQDGAGLQGFFELSSEFGEPAVEWLMRVLSESEQQRVRRPLTRVIADLCRARPECLAPWLDDPRWYVVRNVVHILGWIGGPGVVGWLRAVSTHGEYRVRREVVAALSQVPAADARPVLIAMTRQAETRTLCAVLHQMSTGPDPELAALLSQDLVDPRFVERPAEEQRAVLSALAAVGGDPVLPVLESELAKGSWFSKGLDAHRGAVARCIARIDTPAARAVLSDGLRSRNASVRKACESVGRAEAA